MNDEKKKKQQMPALDGPAMDAVASNYRSRAGDLASRTDILSLEQRLRFLKTADRIDVIRAERFPADSHEASLGTQVGGTVEG